MQKQEPREVGTGSATTAAKASLPLGACGTCHLRPAVAKLQSLCHQWGSLNGCPCVISPCPTTGGSSGLSGPLQTYTH